MPKPLNILLVEDNPGDALLVKEQLRDLPDAALLIHHSQNLEHAVGRMDQCCFDLVLLDLNLPDSSGIDTLARVSQIAPEMPIIVFTGLDNPSIGMEAVHYGAQDYLVKGQVSADAMIRAIRYSMERKRTETLLRQSRVQLEARVKDRTAELERAMAALQDEFDERLRLEREMLQCVDRERGSIGRDLHDMLGSQLTGIALMAKAQERRLQQEGHSAAGEAATLTAAANQALFLARSLSRGLRPVELGEGELLMALRDHLAMVEQALGIRCFLESTGTSAHLDSEKATELFYIVREAVTNAVKHGKAARIWINLSVVDDYLELNVRDDGVGLPKDFDRRRHSGVNIIAHRARTLGGCVEFQRHPQGGTLVTFACSTSVDSDNQAA